MVMVVSFLAAIMVIPAPKVDVPSEVDDDIEDAPPRVTIPLYLHNSTKTDSSHRRMIFKAAEGMNPPAIPIRDLKFEVRDREGNPVLDAEIKIKDYSINRLFSNEDSIVLHKVSEKYNGSVIVVLYKGITKGAVVIVWEDMGFIRSCGDVSNPDIFLGNDQYGSSLRSYLSGK
jgi:hypothetical protein